MRADEARDLVKVAIRWVFKNQRQSFDESGDDIGLVNAIDTLILARIAESRPQPRFVSGKHVYDHYIPGHDEQPSAPERPAEKCGECDGGVIRERDDTHRSVTYTCPTCNGSGSAPRESDRPYERSPMLMRLRGCLGDEYAANTVDNLIREHMERHLKIKHPPATSERTHGEAQTPPHDEANPPGDRGSPTRVGPRRSSR